jgi:hypothetical protein
MSSHNKTTGNTSQSSGAAIQIYRGIDEEFQQGHVPFEKLKIPALSEWMKAEARDPYKMLYVLADINVTATLGSHRRYWIFITGELFHAKGDPFKQGDITAKAFDVTPAYQKGFRGVLQEGVRVEKHMSTLSSFGEGRLYQAADEAARRQDTSVLERLVLEFCMPIAEQMGIF